MPRKPPLGLARKLRGDVYDATAGRPMQWRSLAGISDVAETVEAVQWAVDRGWLLVEGGHSVALTDEGRRLCG
ncbi:MAG: hypothetical protein FD144_1717 [Rhodospirillaceae bacterium]|nr:MAG: hypothetical protein FD144_1717 [Rhodospirillaceae bacterium]